MKKTSHNQNHHAILLLLWQSGERLTRWLLGNVARYTCDALGRKLTETQVLTATGYEFQAYVT